MAYASASMPQGMGVRAEGPVSPFKTLQIPEALGRVTDTVLGGTEAPALIHIQSAHGNYEAEKNIEKLLEYLGKNSSIRLMFLEGAANQLQPELFRIFPQHPDFNRKVTDKLMQEGYLTGPENFLVNQKMYGVRRTEHGERGFSAVRLPPSSSMQAFGVEDLSAYKKDREAFITVTRKGKAAEKYIASLRASIDKRFASKLNKELLNIVRQEETLGSGTLSFEAWLKALAEASRKHLKTDLSDAFYQNEWPFLIRYYRLQAIGAKIDRDKASVEKEGFLKQLETRKISKDVIQAFRDGESGKAEGVRSAGYGVRGTEYGETKKENAVRLTHDSVQASGYSPLRAAFDLAFEKLPKDFSMSAWPHWTLYAQHIILMQEIEGQGLHAEAVRLKDRVQNVLAKTPAEKEYLVASRQLYLLRRLFALELTRSEYEELVRSTGYGVQSQSNNAVRRTPYAFRDAPYAVQKLYNAAMSFYSTAMIRENHMFSNALKRMGAEKQNRAVIVTGGFHADGLKKLASQKGCSYLQISPRITEAGKRDHEIYLRSILGSRDLATSQMSMVLPTDPSAMKSVLGPKLNGWLLNVREIILPMINSEEVSVRPALSAALSRSFLAPAFARAEMREQETKRITGTAGKSKFQASVKGKNRQGVGKWELFDELKAKLEQLPEPVVEELRKTEDIGEERLILTRGGVAVAEVVAGKFLISAIHELLKKRQRRPLRAIDNRLHRGKNGRYLAAYLNDSLDYMVKTYYDAEKRHQVQVEWLDGYNYVARQRLNGIAVPTFIVDATEGKMKEFVFRMENGNFKKTDIAIIQQKVIPLYEYLGQLESEKRYVAQRKLVDDFKKLVIEMYRRGAVDADFGGMLANYGVDVKTGKLLLFDFGDLSGGLDKAYDFADSTEVTNDYLEKGLKTEVGDRIADYFHEHGFQPSDFLDPKTNQSFFGEKVRQGERPEFQMTFPYSEEEIRKIFADPQAGEPAQLRRSETRSNENVRSEVRGVEPDASRPEEDVARQRAGTRGTVTDAFREEAVRQASKNIASFVDVVKGAKKEIYGPRLLSSLASLLARAGLKQEAVLLMNEAIADAMFSTKKSRALSQIGFFFPPGLKGEAEKLLQDVFKVAVRNFSSSDLDADDYARVGLALASCFFKLGLNERALAAIQGAFIGEASGVVFMRAVILLAQIGASQKDTGLIRKALSSAEHIRYLEYRVQALSTIASLWAQIGLPADARVTMLGAYLAALDIESEYSKSLAFSSLATRVAEIELKQDAPPVSVANSGELIKRALDYAKKVKYSEYHPGQKSEALSTVAAAVAQIGEIKRDRGLLKEALNVARSITDDDYYRNQAFMNIAAAFAQLGAKEKDGKLIEEALAIGRSIPGGATYRGEALSEIILSLAQMGSGQEATELMREVLDIAKDMPDGSDEKEQILSNVAAFLEFSGGTGEGVRSGVSKTIITRLAEDFSKNGALQTEDKQLLQGIGFFAGQDEMNALLSDENVPSEFKAYLIWGKNLISPWRQGAGRLKALFEAESGKGKEGSETARGAILDALIFLVKEYQNSESVKYLTDKDKVPEMQYKGCNKNQVGVMPIGNLNIGIRNHVRVDFIFESRVSSGRYRRGGEMKIAPKGKPEELLLLTTDNFSGSLFGRCYYGTLPEIIIVSPDNRKLSAMLDEVYDLIYVLYKTGKLNSPEEIEKNLPKFVLASNGIFYDAEIKALEEKLRPLQMTEETLASVKGHIVRGPTTYNGDREKARGGGTKFVPGDSGKITLAGGSEGVRARVEKVLAERGATGIIDPNNAKALAGSGRVLVYEFLKGIINLCFNAVGILFILGDDGVPRSPKMSEIVTDAKQQKRAREILEAAVALGIKHGVYQGEKYKDKSFEEILALEWDRVCKAAEIYKNHVTSSVKEVVEPYRDGNPMTDITGLEDNLLGYLANLAEIYKMDSQKKVFTDLRKDILDAIHAIGKVSEKEKGTSGHRSEVRGGQAPVQTLSSRLSVSGLTLLVLAAGMMAVSANAVETNAPAVAPTNSAIVQSASQVSSEKTLTKEEEAKFQNAVKYLKGAYAEGRDRVASELGETKDSRVIPALLEALKDKTANVREAAAEALGKFEDPRVVPAVSKLLKDKVPYVRVTAAVVLGEKKDPQAVSALSEALSDKDAWVRQHVVKALGKIKDARAIPALTPILKDEDSVVSNAASAAIKEIKASSTNSATSDVAAFRSEVRQTPLESRADTTGQAEAKGRSFLKTLKDLTGNHPFVTAVGVGGIVLLAGVLVSDRKLKPLEKAKPGIVGISAAALAEKPVAERLNFIVSDLGYPKEVGDAFLALTDQWVNQQGEHALPAWDVRLKDARMKSQQGKITKDALAASEEGVLKEIYSLTDRAIAKKKNSFHLGDVLADRGADCLGYSQVVYVLTRSLGYDVRAVFTDDPVKIRDYGTIEGHVLVGVNLSDSSTVLLDLNWKRFMHLKLGHPLTDKDNLSFRLKNDAVVNRLQVLEGRSLRASVHSQIGGQFLKQGRPDKALENFDKAIEIEPHLFAPLVMRGGHYASIGKFSRALEDLDQAIRIGKSPLIAYFYRGMVHKDMGDLKSSEEDLRKAIGMNDQYVPAYEQLGRVLKNQGRLQEALVEFNTAIRLDEMYASSYLGRGLVKIELNDNDGAIADYSKAIAMDPTYAEAYFDRGKAYARIKNIAAAEKDLLRAQELDPALKPEVQKMIGGASARSEVREDHSQTPIVKASGWFWGNGELLKYTPPGSARSYGIWLAGGNAVGKSSFAIRLLDSNSGYQLISSGGCYIDLGFREGVPVISGRRMISRPVLRSRSLGARKDIVLAEEHEHSIDIVVMFDNNYASFLHNILGKSFSDNPSGVQVLMQEQSAAAGDWQAIKRSIEVAIQPEGRVRSEIRTSENGRSGDEKRTPSRFSKLLKLFSPGGWASFFAHGFSRLIARKKDADQRRNEEMHNAVLMSAMDGFWAVDANGQLLDVNDAYCRMSGYSREELLGLKISDLEVTEGKGEVAAHMRRIIEQGEDRFEAKYRRKDGSVFDVEVSVQYQSAEGGRFVAFLRDITERRSAVEELNAASEALRREHANFLKIFEASPVGLLLLDDDTMVMEANEAVARMVSSNPEELRGKRGGGALGCIHSFENPRGCGFGENCPFCPLRKGVESVLTRGQSARGAEINPTLLIDGEPQSRWFSVNAEPIEIDGKRNVIVSLDDITERKKAEEARRETEAKYQDLFENMQNAFAVHEIITDRNGIPTDYIFLSANRAFEKMTGLTKGNYVGKRVTEVFPGIEKDSADWIGRYGKIALDGGSVTFEQYFAHLGKWFSITAYQPKGGQFATVFTDITERKQAEEKVGWLSSILAGTTDIASIKSLDPDAPRILMANEAFLKAAGKTLEEVVGRTDKEIFGGKIDDATIAQFMKDDMAARLIKTHGEIIREEKNVYPNGETKWVLTRKFPIFDPVTGKLIATANISPDITELKKAEGLLRESEVLYRSVVEDQTELICRYLPDGRLSMVNGAYERYYGKSHMELINRNFVPHIPEPDLQMVLRTIASITRAKPVVEFEHRIVKPNGEIRWQNWTHRGIYNEAGQLIEYQAVGRDVTERKKAEAELKESQARLMQQGRLAAVGTLISGITHELNNPISGLEGVGEQLVRALAEGNPVEAKDHAAEISKNVQRVRKLMTDLLRSVRVDAGGTGSKSVFLIGGSIREALTNFKMKLKIQSEKVVVETRVDEALRAHGDSYKMIQVFVNLIDNAIDAPKGRDDKRVIVSAEEFVGSDGRKMIRMQVSDNGAGADPRDVYRWFEPLFTTKPRDKGTGLGLPLVKGFVEEAGGSVTVDTEVGKGTTFSMVIPQATQSEIEASEREAKATAEVVPSVEIRQIHKILVVEDEDTIGKLYQRNLSRAGYDVVWASNGKKALELLAQPEHGSQPFDLIIVDYTMPDMNGIEFARSFREKERKEPSGKEKTPMVMMTGYSYGVEYDEALGLQKQGVLDQVEPKIMRFESLRDLVAKMKSLPLAAIDKKIFSGKSKVLPVGSSLVIVPSQVRHDINNKLSLITGSADLLEIPNAAEKIKDIQALSDELVALSRAVTSAPKVAESTNEAGRYLGQAIEKYTEMLRLSEEIGRRSKPLTEFPMGEEQRAGLESLINGQAELVRLLEPFLAEASQRHALWIAPRPDVPATIPSTSSVIPGQASSRVIKILFADDEEMLGSAMPLLIKRVLKADGGRWKAEIDIVKSGEEALKVIEAKGIGYYDSIILDNDFGIKGRVDGQELGRMLKDEKKYQGRLVFWSGDQHPGIKRWFDDEILKPATREDVVAKIITPLVELKERESAGDASGIVRSDPPAKQDGSVPRTARAEMRAFTKLEQEVIREIRDMVSAIRGNHNTIPSSKVPTYFDRWAKIEVKLMKFQGPNEVEPYFVNYLFESEDPSSLLLKKVANGVLKRVELALDAWDVEDPSDAWVSFREFYTEMNAFLVGLGMRYRDSSSSLRSIANFRDEINFILAEVGLPRLDRVQRVAATEKMTEPVPSVKFPGTKKAVKKSDIFVIASDARKIAVSLSDNSFYATNAQELVTKLQKFGIPVVREGSREIVIGGQKMRWNDAIPLENALRDVEKFSPAVHSNIHRSEVRNGSHHLRDAQTPLEAGHFLAELLVTGKMSGQDKKILGKALDAEFGSETIAKAVARASSNSKAILIAGLNPLCAVGLLVFQTKLLRSDRYPWTLGQAAHLEEAAQKEFNVARGKTTSKAQALKHAAGIVAADTARSEVRLDQKPGELARSDVRRKVPSMIGSDAEKFELFSEEAQRQLKYRINQDIQHVIYASESLAPEITADTKGAVEDIFSSLQKSRTVSSRYFDRQTAIVSVKILMGHYGDLSASLGRIIAVYDRLLKEPGNLDPDKIGGIRRAVIECRVLVNDFGAGLKATIDKWEAVSSQLDVQGRSEARTVPEAVILPRISGFDASSLRAQLGTAVQVAANIVSLDLLGSPVYASEIEPLLFAGTVHYQKVSVVPHSWVGKWPAFGKMISRYSAASAGNMIIDQRQGIPDAPSVLPLVAFARYNARSEVRLVLIARAREVTVFEKELAVLSPGGVLPANFKIQAFAAESEFVAAFSGFYNSSVPSGKSVALVTDRKDSVVTRKIGSRRKLLSVVGAQDPLKQTASALLAADKLLDESIWSKGYHFVSVEQLGSLELLMAELTSYLSAQKRVTASA